MPEESEIVPSPPEQTQTVSTTPTPTEPASTSPITTTVPLSPKPTPIVTDQSAFPPAQSTTIQSDTILMATTPAAMDIAMRFGEVEEPKPVVQSTSANPAPTTSSPGITITLLILSGARSTFTLNEDYLKQQNISPSDPLQMTVYNLKECVWKDWKEEELNTKQPTSPHLIRLILLGRLLEDKSLLKDCRLQLDNPNVVHLSLRPADIGDDEMTTKGGKFPAFAGGSSRPGERTSPGCRCVIL